MNLHNLIGSREAADLLGIDRATLNRWANEGKLTPAYAAPGVTGVRLYDRDTVQALADSRVGDGRGSHPDAGQA